MRYKAFIVLLFISLAGCQTSKTVSENSADSDTHETLQATLWVQNAAEFDALTRQAYRSAQHWLDAALADSNWSAAIEQKSDYQQLPPAIILDVDETVLDNIPFQARMIEQQSGYNPEAWKTWVKEEKADPIAGAVAFTQAAAAKGIQIFYVTNRSSDLEEATLNNLVEEGFPVDPREDVLLLKNEQADWSSDKTSRRAQIAQNYRIIMLFGDDLNDFIAAKQISSQRRDGIIQQYENRWGRSWFILPNPIYGSWEGALPIGSMEQRSEIIQAKHDLLDARQN